MEAAQQRGVRRRRGREPAEQGLVGGDAERVLVAAGIDGLAEALLGRHVTRRTGVGRRVRGVRRGHLEVVAAVPEGRSREAEVDDADPPVVANDHVRRLKVAVDQPGAVDCGEASTRLHEPIGDGRGLAPRDSEPILQRRPRHELEDQVDAVVDDVDLEHLDDVRVGDPRERPGLTQRREVRAGDVVQELDRDLAVEHRVVGGMDDAHAARPLKREQAVASERGQRLVGSGPRGGV